MNNQHTIRSLPNRTNSQNTIVVYGNSLFSAGVEAGLRNMQNFLVLQINDKEADAAEHIHIAHPDVMIVDVTSVRWEVAISYLREHPNTSLIGLDLTSNKIFTLWCEPSIVNSIRELASVVQLQMATIGN